MGSNNLCYITHHFLFFPYVPIMTHVTFYKTFVRVTSTIFIKGHVGFIQILN